jgi:hypothetical protein
MQKFVQYFFFESPKDKKKPKDFKIAPGVVEIFVFRGSEHKDCSGKREHGLLKCPSDSLQKIFILVRVSSLFSLIYGIKQLFTAEKTPMYASL